MVDEGWGRKAVDFATLTEPNHVREYVTVQHRLGVDQGDRLVDIACGSGLAVELARLRGGPLRGHRRLAAADRGGPGRRNPDADLRVGDMHALPWPDASFDVATSFRGIWRTTPEALAEIHRVLVPGGRVGITAWGHLKVSPGVWAFAPFRLAAQPQVDNQAAMVALGRPGAGEELLGRHGFTDIERIDVPSVLEFADPVTYARAMAATGPAYEAIQNVGEQQFLDAAVGAAETRVRAGLPLRAEIDLVGYLARTGGSENVQTSGSTEA